MRPAVRLRCLARRYPRPFWTLLSGYFINRASAALIWPYLTLVMRERLDAPLAVITSLISIQAFAGLLSASAIGAVMDRFGRKRPMVISLALSSGVLLAMSAADALWQWMILIALYGAINPIFMVGSNAMVADLVPSDERVKAYALLRVTANLGIAVGPAIGGFLMVISYALPYAVTAAVNLLLALFAWRLLAETLPDRPPAPSRERIGYRALLADHKFLALCGSFLLVELAAAMVWVLLPVYTKEQFAIREDAYGWLLTINAGMVVTLQFGVTRITGRYAPLLVMALGALIYAAALLAIGGAANFGGFALAMVILTTGELILVPTATAWAANLAPPDMRARYMGVFSITYTVGSGIGPVIGGFLSDHLAPNAAWYGGAAIAVTSTLAFLTMARAYRAQPNLTATETALRRG